MKQHNTVLPQHRGTEPEYNRHDIAKRIATLKDAIRRNLMRAGSAAYRGRVERALELAEMAQKQRALLLTLADKASALSKLDATPNRMDQPKPARTKTKVARKVYKTWDKK